MGEAYESLIFALAFFVSIVVNLIIAEVAWKGPRGERSRE
jgi:hypothetical protein